MKIYTKTGDQGETSLYSGGRVWKDDPLMEAIGNADELNSQIGYIIAALETAAFEHFQENALKDIKKQLFIIQHALFDMGAAIATPETKAGKTQLNKTRFNHKATEILEKWIDQMDLELAPLKKFILPGGHPIAAATHVARCICRRLERSCIPCKLHQDINGEILQYINRLSDYLFTLSRYINLKMQCEEIFWQHHLVDHQ